MSRPAGVERLRRVLAMIPWVVARGGATVEELVRQFGGTAAQVEHDLTRAMVCEVGPNLDHVAMWIEDGVVHAAPGAFFERPRRLTPAQGVALLAAVDALRQLQSGTALDSLGAKLASALGATTGSVAVVLDEPPLLGVVRSAIERHERLHLCYYTASRDEVTERDVDPMRVVAFGNVWHLDAWCWATGARRRFRVDRIRSASLCGVPAEAHGDVGPLEVFEPAEHAMRVVLELTPDQRWVAERHPHSVEGGRIVLQVAGLAWLEQLLLRLGPDAVVVSPENVTEVRREAARRVLARYRA